MKCPHCEKTLTISSIQARMKCTECSTPLKVIADYPKEPLINKIVRGIGFLALVFVMAIVMKYLQPYFEPRHGATHFEVMLLCYGPAFSIFLIFCFILKAMQPNVRH